MKRIIATAALCLLLPGCERETPVPSDNTASPVTEQPSTEVTDSWASALTRDGETAHLTLSESVAQLKEAVDSFLASPGNDSHKAARDAWRRAHEAYKAVSLYRYLGLKHAPFEQTSENPVQHSLTSRLDLYPLEPGYLDAVEGYPFSGLVFSESVPVTVESLNEQHQFGDETYVVFGYHPIEFLLWGENSSQETRRPWQDFQRPKQGQAGAGDASEANVREASKVRRRDLLATITEKLLEDVHLLAGAWRESGVYPQQFLSIPETQQSLRLRRAIARIIQREVERPLLQLAAADSEQAPEPPESAFSRNTHADLLATLQPLNRILSPGNSNGHSALGLSQEQFLAATEQQKQLHGALSRLSDNLFSTLFGQLRPEDRELLQQALEHAAALRELLQSQPAPRSE